MRLRIVCICIVGAAMRPRGGASLSPSRTAFVTSDQCIACHSNLHTAAGEDVSIGYDWRSSTMANSARDPYWHAARAPRGHGPPERAGRDRRQMRDVPHADGAFRSRSARGERGRGIREHLGLVARESAGGRRRVVHRVPSDRGRRTSATHASFDGGFEIDTARRRASGRSTVRTRSTRPSSVVMHSATSFVPTEIDAPAAVGALRDLPHALYERSRRAPAR